MFRPAIVLLLICLPLAAGAAEQGAPTFSHLPALQAPARLDDQGRLVYWSLSPHGTSTAHTTPLESVRFLTADGQDVSVEDATKRLVTWSSVLIVEKYFAETPGDPDPSLLARELDESVAAWIDESVEAWKRDAFYQHYLKSDTLVVVMVRQNLICHPLDRKIPATPRYAIAKWLTNDGSSELELQYFAWKPVWETRVKTISEAGVGTVVHKDIEYKVGKIVPEMRSAHVPADHLQLFDIHGKRIAPERYPELFAERRSVVVSADGEPVHTLYLRNLKEDMLVVVPPKAEVPAPPAGARPKVQSLPVAAPAPAESPAR